MQPLSRDHLYEQICSVLDDAAWSVRVTLITGDILFGDIWGRHASLTHPEPGVIIHIPGTWPRKVAEATGYGITVSPFHIIFNSEQGTTHGWSWLTEVREDAVTEVTRLQWSDALLRDGIKNIPNPYATVLAQHNRAVGGRVGFDTKPYVEQALPTEHVTQAGITFRAAELLYADYTFFERLSSTTFGLSAPFVAAEVSIGVSSVVSAVLAGKTSGKVVLPSNMERQVGFIEPVAEEVTTEIEGEEWVLFLFAQAFPRLNERVPVLVKRSSISYPRELWPYIQSPLVLLGERRQIPFAHGGRSWAEMITARAIGFVPSANS